MSKNNYAGKEVKRTVRLYACKNDKNIGVDDYRFTICDMELGGKYILLDQREICMVVPENHPNLDATTIEMLRKEQDDLRVDVERDVQKIEEVIQSMRALPAPEEI